MSVWGLETIHLGATAFEKRRGLVCQSLHERPAETADWLLVGVEIVGSFGDVVVIFADGYPALLPLIQPRSPTLHFRYYNGLLAMAWRLARYRQET